MSKELDLTGEVGKSIKGYMQPSKEARGRVSHILTNLPGDFRN